MLIKIFIQTDKLSNKTIAESLFEHQQNQYNPQKYEINTKQPPKVPNIQ